MLNTFIIFRWFQWEKLTEPDIIKNEPSFLPLFRGAVIMGKIVGGKNDNVFCIFILFF